MKTRQTFWLCGLGSWLAMASLVSAIHADDADLEPLRYNNPGLTVDLGVGLWAWPMPLDYDGDGDLDLLVACPDKPSNGVYYFENPTQDPEVKLPVFKPGVRLGKAGHNMQVSYVAGEPRILINGAEFPRNQETGTFDFSKPKKLYPRNNIHTGRVRGNMWRYVDFDGDGDHDLTVGVGDWSDYVWDHAFDGSGKWKNGPLHGYVYWIENRGTDAVPDYSDQPTQLKADGLNIDVYGWPSQNFADFDGDGDLDLLCGEFMDGFTYFQNVGTRTSPQYAAGNRLIDTDGAELTMDLQMITPTAIDWDADGDLDLIVGDEDGRVALIENTGTLDGETPVFSKPKYLQQQADTLKFGALATPFAVDWDRDGDQDILCGNTAGQIGYFENLGLAKNGLPIWEAPKLLTAADSSTGTEAPFRIMAGENGSIQGPCEAKWGYTTFSIADWDGDGDWDIIYNSILARLGILKNENGVLVDVPFDAGVTEAPPAWYGWQADSAQTLTQWRTTPLAFDFNGDERQDLILLDQSGYLTLRSAGGPAERIFVDESGAPLQLNPRSCGSSGRVKLAVVDWDQDGRVDVLVNSENALWYRNVAERDGKIVLKRIGNLASRNVAGHTSSPAVCDFNQDETPDLLVGAENGRLYHIAHENCIEFSEKSLQLTAASKSKDAAMPGLISETFIYKKAPFKEAHASTICETSRGLVAAWFGGTKEKNKDVCIWTSYFDGQRWSTPRLTADGVQHDKLRYPCWNPVLFEATPNGPLLLFFKVGPDPKTWWGEMMVSYDRGRSFRDRVRLPEGIDGPVRCKPILVDGGQTLLCGSSTEYDGWRVHFERIGLNDGLPSGTWQRVPAINDASRFNAIQPTLLTTRDGKILALCRSREGVIVQTESSDEGRSWSSLEPIDLPNPNSGIDGVTLADGRQLLVYNHLPTGANSWGRRGRLDLAISDDAKTWYDAGTLEIEPTAEFSYPAMIQTVDGKVHLTYTWKRERVKHVVVDPDALKVGARLTKELKGE